ncbi:MAG: sigma-54-dependent Fis family transcriptional regulator [Bacteroides sp.]|nr:sigma-54-dependent Fis family transcriptional regulator [Bacteroides sp.]
MILIIDDDPAIRATLILLLRRAGHEVEAVSSPAEALALFRTRSYRLMLMDMNFSSSTSGEEGLHLLRQAHIFQPGCPVILITAWGSISLAVEGMRAGAFDFITKPWDNRMLLARIATALELTSDETSPASPDFSRAGIIGRSPALEEVLRQVERVAPSDAPVLILGENGTGKELIARALHANSRRASAPMVEVNLGGIPNSLFESEMFGHAKGAFTGAVAARKGRFELADRGTIFLDEIGELDQASQVKLLRVLQEHTFEPLGESRSRTADVRVISATNADLRAMVAAGTFREDLFYRLNLITLRLPPLRERREDIPLLARHFAREYARENSMEPPEISRPALDKLMRLNYPGNIRQLRNMVCRAVIINREGPLMPDDFEDTAAPASDTSPVASGATLAEMERVAIEEAMRRHEGNLSRVAASLGITRQALYRKLEKMKHSAKD